MWKQLVVISAAAAALSIAVAADADARGMGMRGDAGFSFQDRAMTGRAGFDARAEVREPQFRPHGWSEGRKTGWHCRVGTHGCIPPGLR